MLGWEWVALISNPGLLTTKCSTLLSLNIIKPSENGNIGLDNLTNSFL